ncbi:MAG: KH domain-containing protein [Oculatellaceae cyanobacterium bins.114]|nr:KH domain-containing protein [Oculatellaceae cyanobacterium bins.114]
MPDLAPTQPTPQASTSNPNYIGLVRFLMEPFLESPESLKVDCEVSPRKSRVLIRVAFEGEDKGRVFGRGGRNIQAIRTVLQAVAQISGYSVHLDIYGSQTAGREGGSEERPSSPRSQPRRPPRPHRN